MSAQPQTPLTPEEYLELERAAEFRHEYYKGHMYAMAGASLRHVIITGNFAGELRNALKARPCVVATNDLRIRVSEGGLYTYPDIVAVCGKPLLLDQHQDTLLNPTLIVEVLSPTTEAYDRGFKSAQYRTLESLQEYALVSQSEPRVEIYRRQPSGDWLLSESAAMDAVCRFDSVGCTLALRDIYDKVTFDEEEVPGVLPNVQNA